MIEKKFIALEKNRAVRKALDFWYRNFKDTCSLKNFLIRCRWKKEGNDFVIIYRGIAPLVKK